MPPAPAGRKALVSPKSPDPTFGSLGRGFHYVPDEEIDRDPSAEPPPIDYTPLVDAACQVSAWLLDIARKHTSDPLDQAAIERIARAADALATGRSVAGSAASEEDVLVFLGILVDAFEIDGRIENLGAVIGALYASADQLGAPIWRMVRAILRKPGGGSSTPPVATAPNPRTATIRIPVVVRRRPCLAHGHAELGDTRTVLVIG